MINVEVYKNCQVEAAAQSETLEEALEIIEEMYGITIKKNSKKLIKCVDQITYKFWIN